MCSATFSLRSADVFPVVAWERCDDRREATTGNTSALRRLGYHQPSGNFCRNRQFRHNRHFRQNGQSPRGQDDFRHYRQPSGYFWQNRQSPRGQDVFHHYHQASSDFAKIANFAKIASLQGATFGIRFKSPEAGDFFAIFAIACISGHKWGNLGGGVPPGSPNPVPVSDQKMLFSTPVFRPDLLNPYLFSDLAFRQK